MIHPPFLRLLITGMLAATGASCDDAQVDGPDRGLTDDGGAGGAGGSGGAAGGSGGVTVCTRDELNGIRNPEQWAAAFAACEWFEGDLTYTTLSPLTQGIPPQVTVLDAPRLVRITGEVDLRSPTLEEVRLPALRDVGGEEARVTFDGCDALTQVHLPALWAVTTATFNDNPALVELDLARLRTAINIEISNTGLLALALPTLERVELLAVWANPALTRVAAPALRTVARSLGRGQVEARLDLSRNDRLATIDLSGLAWVEDTLTIAQNPVLQTLAFPAWTTYTSSYEGTAAGVTFASNAALTTLDLGALTEVADPGLGARGEPLDWVVAGLPALTTLRLPSVDDFPHTLKLQDVGLTEITLPFTVLRGSLHVRVNPALVRLAAPALTTIGYVLFVIGNPALSELSLPALTRARAHDVSENPALPQAQIDALDAQLNP